MKDKGFTLVELITVLSVLALLSLIVMPIMTSTISKSKQKALVTQKNYLIDATQKYAMEISNNLPIYEGAKYSVTLQELKNNNYIEDEDIIDPTTNKEMKGCIELTYQKKSKKYKYDYVETCKNYALGPILDDNMIPVIYKSGKWVTIGNNKWYDYDAKQWANAAVIKPSSVSKYKDQTLEIEIQMSDVLGMFVWIPRFSYTIQTKNASGTVTYGHNSTNINAPGSISIKFINQSILDEGVAYYIGDIDTNYRTHEAFYNDINNNGIRESNEELSGIWVGKFLTSSSNSDLCTSTQSELNCNKIFTSDLNINPNQKYLINQSVENQYSSARYFSRNAKIDLESKMMNNKEYGALLYLTQSIYGRCTTQSSCSAFVKNTSSFTGGGSGYISNTGYSSTINNTGVYDMTGSVSTRVLATYQNPFTIDINNRYYDSYTSSSADVACNGDNCYGHGLEETNKWYASSINPSMPNQEAPYLVRGISSTFSPFYYEANNGLASTNIGFRIVLQAS